MTFMILVRSESESVVILITSWASYSIKIFAYCLPTLVQCLRLSRTAKDSRVLIDLLVSTTFAPAHIKDLITSQTIHFTLHLLLFSNHAASTLSLTVPTGKTPRNSTQMILLTKIRQTLALDSLHLLYNSKNSLFVSKSKINNLKEDRD